MIYKVCTCKIKEWLLLFYTKKYIYVNDNSDAMNDIDVFNAFHPFI